MSKTTRQAWEQGIDRELAWWRSYLLGAGAGVEGAKEFRARFDREAELQPHVAAVLPRPSYGTDPRILDCAAGPTTILGRMLNGRSLAISAVDALADHYAEMLDELNLMPPVPTLTGEVEHLDGLFEPDSFDLVYMRFALDHCHDPLRALQQMVRVARPGGVVIVEHYRNESETEYEGLRQWDLRPQPNDLIVANPAHSFSVSKSIPTVRLGIEFSPTWLTMLLTKD